MVKKDAAKLFRDYLSRKSWHPEPITFSGVTDCYQPAERQFRLTRQCLEVAEDCSQPVNIVTKNALVTRDIELLSRMAGAESGSRVSFRSRHLTLNWPETWSRGPAFRRPVFARSRCSPRLGFQPE